MIAGGGGGYAGIGTKVERKLIPSRAVFEDFPASSFQNMLFIKLYFRARSAKILATKPHFAPNKENEGSD